MERHEIMDAMTELKLYGMRAVLASVHYWDMDSR